MMVLRYSPLEGKDGSTNSQLLCVRPSMALDGSRALGQGQNQTQVSNATNTNTTGTNSTKGNGDKGNAASSLAGNAATMVILAGIAGLMVM